MKIEYGKEEEKLLGRNVKRMKKSGPQQLLEIFDGGVFKKEDLEGRGLLFSDIERILKEAVKSTQKEDLEKFNNKTDSLQKYTKELKLRVKEKQEEISKLNIHIDKLRARSESKDDFLNEFLTKYMDAVKELRSEIIGMINNGRTISIAEIDRLSKPLLDRPSIEDSKVFIDPTELREDLDPHIKVGSDDSLDDGVDIDRDLDKLRSLVGKNKIINKEGD